MKTVHITSLITTLVFSGSILAQETALPTNDETSQTAPVENTIDPDLENRLLDAISAITGKQRNMEEVVQLESVLRGIDQHTAETDQAFELRLMDTVSDIIGHRVNMEEALQIEAAIKDTVYKAEK